MRFIPIQNATDKT
uniref:Uncharacterized protein n=1 Tax=Anguilla anguilla TaxID=7936 RepID=A0A0E9U8S3_ANGAN